MPRYTFSCDPSNGGCGEEFEISCFMSDYSTDQKCPECGLRKSIVRIFDMPEIIVGAQTLGMTAIKNTEKMSDAEKAHLHYEHNKYKYDDSTTPTGKKSMLGKDGQPKISNKQYANDPYKNKTADKNKTNGKK